ncbi:nuclear factor 7, brain-like [Astyanax mexicanus]|uniref:Nuclear factor 7, brain-like n=1 Tax=Astyanax mexicanus TaxID=7994 RepID=A0A8B9HNH3_ASTMX|nr:nuclear factor 7, brain-like [Astyanax mexicanus]
MASRLSCHIECSLCLSDFTDPVSLSCDHSYCRQCITGHMQANPNQSSCPECRKPFTEKDLRPSRLLRNMTGAVRRHLSSFSSPTSPTETPASAPAPALTTPLTCADHEEKLKLFCETDQKLACVVCRDGEKHRGHQFKPVKEAAQIVKAELKGAIGFLAKENIQLCDMSQKQTAEITKTEIRSKNLSDQISAQFEELHQFLRKKEEEIKKQLKTDEKKAVESMCKNSSVMTERLMEGKETECIFQSALQIPQPDQFLQWWNEKGLSATQRMKKKDSSGQNKYRSRLTGLTVIPHSLFLGLRETHLQFFVWKEMLNSIKPVPETFTFKETVDSYLRIAPGGAHVWHTKRKSKFFADYSPGIVSTESFRNGQHYWELEVGKKLDWSVGVKVEKDSGVHLHLRDGKGYTLSYDRHEFDADVKGKPRKIGLYMDCERKNIYFYDADSMSQICIISYKSDLPWSISLNPGLYLGETNNDPLAVCSYRAK